MLSPGHPIMALARIAVAGTSGFIGAAVCEALVEKYEVVALTRSMARPGQPEPRHRIQLRACDHYSRKELEVALQGVDYAVYLVHNRDPSARLDQARTRDRDLLVADNFARAAAKTGVKQIVYRAQLLPTESGLSGARTELEEVLASHGVPVTVLRTTLVVGSGGELARLLVRMVRRLPVIPLPKSAETGIRPISLADLLAAIDHCVGNPDTFDQKYPLVGGDRMTFREMLEDTAWALEPVPKHPRAATTSGGMLRRYRFVSRIASGDTEKEGPAGPCGSWVKGADAAERPPDVVPPGWGGGQSPAASGSNRVEPLCSSRLSCGEPPGAPSAARGGFGTGSLHRRPRILSTGLLGDRLFALMLRFLYPTLHLEFLAYLLGTMASEMEGQENPVERAVARKAMPFREALLASVQSEGASLKPAHRAQDDHFIRLDARVRSIQRMSLPAERNAAWMADHYFAWLGTLIPFFLKTERDAEGSWTVYANPGRIRMLALDFKPTHSSPDRMMYFITGGLLARFLGGRTARLEFRDFLDGRFTLVAIHDFNPALPWYFYRFTQAVIHGIVMKGFQGHMGKLAAEMDR